MIKKEYFTPEADILRMNAEMNFCASGDVPNMTVDSYTPDWEI